LDQLEILAQVVLQDNQDQLVPGEIPVLQDLQEHQDNQELLERLVHKEHQDRGDL
jgi:hypothetical protein